MLPCVLHTLPSGLLAVHKPAGMPVHRAAEHDRPDLGAWLESLQPGCRPCHRLDLDASGLVLCAADPALRAQVGTWLQEGQVGKHYLVMVHGRMRKKGTVRRPLQDARRGRKLPATTRYRSLEWFDRATLVEALIETGRKHQLRRHMQGLGHSIVGDRRYGPRRFKSVPGFPGRLWLHAAMVVLPDGTVLRDPLPEALVRHLGVMRGVGEE